MFLQRFVKLTGYLPLSLFCGMKVYGRENLPKEPCILVANHGSMMDPVLLQVVFPMKHISFLCAKRLFQCPRICQAFLRRLGAVPVIDGVSEMKVLKERADKADENHLIGFFSQGRISQTQTSFMPGAAVLALQTGLPLVPVFMRCAPFYKGGSRIRIGKPVSAAKTAAFDRAQVDLITQDIRTRVYELSITPATSKRKKV